MKIDFLETIKTPFLGAEGAVVRKRSFHSVMLYAMAYPFSTGIVIYAGLMTFSMVLTNITGFLPQIAKDLYEGKLNTAGSIFLWSEGEKHLLIRREAWLRIVVMCSFIGGAMLSVALFPAIGSKVFYVPSMIVLAVMLFDIWTI
ncbi:MAG: hypothetical protein Q7T20_03625 [Saprospiraceae bacterium]|nr:hypothetical protein [Saprospiraceae bacterium]